MGSGDIQLPVEEWSDHGIMKRRTWVLNYPWGSSDELPHGQESHCLEGADFILLEVNMPNSLLTRFSLASTCWVLAGEQMLSGADVCFQVKLTVAWSLRKLSRQGATEACKHFDSYLLPVTIARLPACFVSFTCSRLTQGLTWLSLLLSSFTRWKVRTSWDCSFT